MKVRKIRTVTDNRGSLSFVEVGIDLSFPIKRIYYLYGLNEASRGGHAHKRLHQAFIAMHGSFSICLFDGRVQEKHTLSHPNEMLIVPPGLWRDLGDFKDDCVVMVLASELYNEDDYIREYNEYIRYIDEQRTKIL
jgi:dTDP-4-dehydrorhamnose 3,5-epimerase-like enzyme